MNTKLDNHPKTDNTGCAGGFLFLSLLLIVLSTFGYVIGLSGKKVSLEGVELGVITGKTYIILLIIAAALLVVSGISWLQKRRHRKR